MFTLLLKTHLPLRTFLFFLVACTFYTHTASAQLCDALGGETYTLLNNAGQTTSTSTLGTDEWVGESFEINGSLLINSDFLIESCTLKMGVGAKIEISPDCGSFIGTNSKYFSCAPNGTWTGVIIMNGMNGSVLFSQNHFENADAALRIESSIAQVTLYSNYFNLNKYGLAAIGNSINMLATANTFDCSSNITNPEFICPSEVGIFLQDCPSATIGFEAKFSYNQNAFRRQRVAGLLVKNSNVLVKTAYFEQNGIGISADNSMITVIGGAIGSIYPPVSFWRNILNDISTTNSVVRVERARFDGCFNTNVVCNNNTHNEPIRITKSDFTLSSNTNTQPGNTKYAIIMDRTSGGVWGIGTNFLESNTILIQDFGSNVRGGVKIKGHPNSSGTLILRSNLINAYSGGAEDHSTSLFEVIVDQSDNNNIGPYNRVNSYNNPTSGGVSNNRWCFHVHDGYSGRIGNRITQNSVFGNNSSTIDRGTCAMHNVNTYEVFYCGNKTSHTYRGMHFMGNCGNSTFARNELGNHAAQSFQTTETSTGLLLENALDSTSSFLGTQYCRGNKWLTNEYTNGIAAWLRGSTPEKVVANLFTVKPPITGQANENLPIPRTPSEWFTTDQSCGSGTSCEQTTPLDGGDVRTLNDNDIRIALTTPHWQSNSSVSLWEEKKQLIGKLMAAPTLLDSSQDVADFYDEHRHTSPDLFARFDSLIQIAFGTPAALHDSILMIGASVDTIIDRLDSLDASIPDSAATFALSSTFFTYRTSLINQISTLMLQWNSMRSQTDQYRTPLFNAGSAYNQSLPSGTLYEANQKFLNKLMIKYGRGQSFSQTDYDTLRLIAHQCPEIAGRTRERAIAWLPSEEAPFYQGEVFDYSDCTGDDRGRPQKRSPEEVGMYIVPSPADAAAHLLFLHPYSGDIFVTDIAGKRVVSLTNLVSQSQVVIHTATLSPGLYFITTPQGLDLRSARLIVAH